MINSYRRKEGIKSNFRKKNVLVFLGAGATICFGGPKSSEILSELITDEKFKTKNNKPVGKYLYDVLYNSFGEQTNFETIIAAIELIISYHLAKENDSENPNLKSIIPTFLRFDDSLLDQIDNFTIHDIGSDPDYVILEYYANGIPQIMTWPRKTARLYYYHEILKHFLSLISIKIARYEDGSAEYNSKFNNFINNLISRNHHINFYTTNYDNLVPNIFDNIQVFNGFDIRYSETGRLRFNQNRIIFDDSAIKFFNLHGSIYWDYEFLMDQAESQFTFKDKEFCLPLLSQTDFTNPGEELVLSNIITGYNKAQRTLTPPFSLMLESFLKECLRADVLIIIGYSFSDNHLNKILSTCLNEKSIRIINVTHSSNGYLNTPEGQKFVSMLKSNYKLSNPTISENSISSHDKDQIIFFKGFDEFLDDETNWNFIYQTN